MIFLSSIFSIASRAILVDQLQRARFGDVSLLSRRLSTTKPAAAWWRERGSLHSFATRDGVYAQRFVLCAARTNQSPRVAQIEQISRESQGKKKQIFWIESKTYDLFLKNCIFKNEETCPPRNPPRRKTKGSKTRGCRARSVSTYTCNAR